MKQPEQLHPQLAYEAIEALDSVFTDNIALEETAEQLRAKTANAVDEAAIIDMVRGDRKNLDARWDYALKAVSGKTIDGSVMVEAVTAYAAAQEKQGTEVDPSRLTAISAAVITAAYYKRTADAYDSEVRPYRSHEWRMKQAADLEVDKIIEGPRRSVQLARFDRDEQRPGRVWISVTDPRTFKVAGTSPERVVAEYNVVDVQPAGSGAGSQVTFMTGERTTRIISAEDRQARNVDSDRYKIGHPESLSEQGTVVEKVENPDGSLSLTYVSGSSPKKVHIAPDDDAYRLGPDGKTVQVYIPGGRASLERVSSAGLDALTDGVDSRSVRRIVESTAEVALQAAGGKRRNVIETFRPVNTGDPSDPQVNPIPLSVGKTS